MMKKYLYGYFSSFIYFFFFLKRDIVDQMNARRRSFKKLFDASVFLVSIYKVANGNNGTVKRCGVGEGWALMKKVDKEYLNVGVF